MKYVDAWKTILGVLVATASLTAQGKVLVFVAGTQPPVKIEKAISGASSSDVRAFAKFNDFNMGLESDKPDFVIAPDAFKEMADNYTPVGALKVEGKSTTKLILLSADQSWKGKDISAGRVGIIELAKRDKMKSYVNGLFGKEFKGMKTVSKAEDLFPLLVFKSVDFIAVEPYVYNELKSKFTTQVFEVGSSKELPNATVFMKSGVTLPKEIESLKEFDLLSIK